MYKENLFELIRKEEVIIWAGAGMSLYAGYPSGKRLAEILVENLTPKEKESIDIKLPLPDLAEEFYRLKGNNKNSLIRILNEIFFKRAESTEVHKNLAIIPHFKTIITTNYDTLFEDIYNNKAQTIYSTKQIPYIDNKKTQIFKVHGDLKEPDSIILTKSDYNDFFKDNRENGTYWSVIRERLATNNVLFLGYNIEDPNVSVVFDRITESFGENRKECFLVAPDLPKHKENDLLRKGIHYINSTAESIITELLLHLKEHIISDIEKGKVSADTFRYFLANIDLHPDLKGSSNNYVVTSLKGIKNDVNGKIHLTLKNDQNFIKELNDFAKGRKFGTFEVPDDKLLKIDFRYGDVRYPNPEGLSKLRFESTPNIESKIDIRFEDGFEFSNIPIKLYSSPSLIEAHLETDNANIIAKANLETSPWGKVNFTYRHKEICKSIKSEIELFTFLKKLSEGKFFTVYTEYGELNSNVTSISSELLDQAIFFLDYFNDLNKIEKFYKLRFSNIPINDINDSTIKTVKYIIYMIENQYLVVDWDGELSMTLIENYSDKITKQLKRINEINSPVMACHKIEEIIELHGQKINFGYKKEEFQDMYVINVEEILTRKNNIVRMKSRSKKIHVSFTKNFNEENI